MSMTEKPESGKARKRKTLLAWSGGKESAWSLYLLQQNHAVEMVGLFAGLNAQNGRVSRHFLRRSLVERQAEAVGLPVEFMNAPHPYDKEEADRIVAAFVGSCVSRGIERIAYGSVKVERTRRSSEEQLKGTGIEPLFPLGKIRPADLAEAMFESGLEIYISSVNRKMLPEKLAGRKWTRELLEEMPGQVEGAWGGLEYHTLVVDGPMFRARLPVRVEGIEVDDRYAYADFVLASEDSHDHLSPSHVS